MDYLGKLSNFALIFCLMPVLHKKSRQSLTVFPETPFDWNIFKVGSAVIVYTL